MHVWAGEHYSVTLGKVGFFRKAQIGGSNRNSATSLNIRGWRWSESTHLFNTETLDRVFERRSLENGAEASDIWRTEQFQHIFTPCSLPTPIHETKYIQKVIADSRFVESREAFLLHRSHFAHRRESINRWNGWNPKSSNCFVGSPSSKVRTRRGKLWLISISKLWVPLSQKKNFLNKFQSSCTKFLSFSSAN